MSPNPFALPTYWNPLKPYLGIVVVCAKIVKTAEPPQSAPTFFGAYQLCLGVMFPAGAFAITDRFL
ncbi:hypothetical protein OE88DRAFT_1665310 [Heliocybe sulcata]|uniref:Uncharacterized protein n=1 Tax=Heliocybe sulcata TaxID=5364 RepID=A0A5C3MRR5_9AGAM|nr:hypothetical protein OE88DRAFT_1665310 [Heliocybe sulcata]